MKILHIWNIAGVGSIIAKYMDKYYGTSSWVIMRKLFDKFGLTIYGELWDCGAKTFTLKALLKARKFDIIHIHGFDRILPYLRVLYSNKPLIMHYHGSDIRGHWQLRKKYYRKADAILVSTSDLLENAPENVQYLPNPVDTEIFYRKHPSIYPKTAFHFGYRADDVASQYAKRYGLKLVIHNRTQTPIPYIQLADVLCDYDYYIDVKRSKDGILLGSGTSLSKVGLESLACGLKVIRWDGELVETLPKEHDPIEVIKKLFNIYQEVTRK